MRAKTKKKETSESGDRMDKKVYRSDIGMMYSLAAVLNAVIIVD